MGVSICVVSLVIVSTILGSVVLVLLIGLFFYIRRKRKFAPKRAQEKKAVDGVKQSKTRVVAVLAEKKANPPAPKPPQSPAQKPIKVKEMSYERRAEEGAAGFATVDAPKPKTNSVVVTQPTQLDTFKKPDNETMADAKDPNYRSMKGIGNDVFNVPTKPAENFEDQYEVLSNLQNNVPTAETKTPVGDQYESLADLNNQEIIDKKAAKENEKPVDKNKEGVSTKGEEKISNKNSGRKLPEKALEEKKAVLPDVPTPLPTVPPARKKGPAFKRPEMGKVSSKNPQYETFAVVSDAIFKESKKPE